MTFDVCLSLLTFLKFSTFKTFPTFLTFPPILKFPSFLNFQLSFSTSRVRGSEKIFRKVFSDSPFLYYYNYAILLGQTRKGVLIKTPIKLGNYAPAIHGKGQVHKQHKHLIFSDILNIPDISTIPEIPIIIQNSSRSWFHVYFDIPDIPYIPNNPVINIIIQIKLILWFRKHMTLGVCVFLLTFSTFLIFLTFQTFLKIGHSRYSQSTSLQKLQVSIKSQIKSIQWFGKHMTLGICKSLPIFSTFPTFQTFRLFLKTPTFQTFPIYYLAKTPCLYQVPKLRY